MQLKYPIIKDGKTPLHIACYNISFRVIRLLERKCSTTIHNRRDKIAQQIPLNEDGDCLHIACQWGDVDVVRHLLTDEYQYSE